MSPRPFFLASPVVLSLLVAACSSSSEAVIPSPAAAQAPADPAAGDEDTKSGEPKTPALPAGGSAGCGKAQAQAAAGSAPPASRTLDVNGDARTYVLAMPSGYDPYRAYPLVFVFHSGGGTGARTRDYFGFGDIAGDKAIFVYPDGHDGEWDLDSPAKDNDDVAFFDALLADLESHACVDTTRVFATGSSMGAYFSNQLGCRRGDVLRAIAPHAGGGPYGGDSEYADDGHLKCAGKPVAAMVFHGDNDQSVNVSEGESSIAHWAWANGCTSTAKPSAPSPCVAYEGCKSPVVWCKVSGIGHRVWSNGPKATWDFFASF